MSATYFVIAYRWGCTNLHHYFVYCGQDRTKADALANAECSDRGGKYGVAVYEFDTDGTNYNLASYFGAIMHQEEKPFHNHRIDFFQSLGHKFADFAQGRETHVEDSIVKWKECDPPQWVKDEYEREKKTCEFMERK